MKHFRIKKKTTRFPVFIPGVNEQKNISNLSKPILPRKMVWDVHSILRVEWEDPEVFSAAKTPEGYRYTLPPIRGFESS